MPVKAPAIDYWGTVTDRRSEPDIRREIINTLEGNFPEIAKGYMALLRKMRRSSTEELLLCSCVDEETGEPDKEIYCPISFSERYLWDEAYVTVYKWRPDRELGPPSGRNQQAGLLDLPFVVFYLRYDVEVTQDDKVVEIALDLEGVPASPLRRVAVYRIHDLVSYRGDNGRIEYHKAVCSEENVRFLNPP